MFTKRQVEILTEERKGNSVGRDCEGKGQEGRNSKKVVANTDRIGTATYKRGKSGVAT